MCDRCESKGLLAGLMAKAGVASVPARVLASAPASVPESEAALPLPPTSKPVPARRRKLWELEDKHHCPVIGSCLNLDELKKIARKDGFSGKHFDAYRLHVEAVSLSCSRNAAAESMHKLLERKYALVIKRFERAKTDAEVLALWQECLERGEVAGPMWAVLTHKAASMETRKVVYGDVHMLSHQIGAGQAADLRRLQWLEKQRVELIEETACLKDVQRVQAEQLVALRQALQAEQAQSALLAPLLKRLQELESGQAMIGIGRQLMLAEAQAARAREADMRIRALEEKLGVLRAEKARLTRERDEIELERDALEQLWSAQAVPPVAACDGDCAACPNPLRGRCVLCVGGRTPLLPQYRALAERLGVRLIHHDGGKEEALARLPDLLNASDAVICPTDCVGHLAYYQLKKHCKQNSKPCVLTRNSGVAGFAAALTRLAEGRADIQSQT
jgi:hypothetical protein